MGVNIVFIHGTGVRQPAYGRSFDIIKGKLIVQNSSWQVYECYWGETCGSKLNAQGKSIPTFQTNRSPSGDPTDDEYVIGLWELLYRDPLFELQILSLRESTTSFVPGQQPPGTALDVAVRTFIPSTELLNKFAEAGIQQDDFNRARNQIIAEKDYQNAVNQAQAPIDEYRKAVAKALVAQSAFLVREKYGGQALCLTGENRDDIVNLIVGQIGGSSRGVVDWVKTNLLGPVKRIAINSTLQVPTSIALRKRGSISESFSASVGDVIMYQSRGQEIRDFIRRTIENFPTTEPIVLIAHSLGGIACVDLLLETDPPKVDLLVTVGSQAPLLYEWNALVNQKFDKDFKLPDSFPQWLNIYDERDFLSYLAADIFVSKKKVEDVRVKSGQPFPESHGAYWGNKAVWQAIFDRMPK
jgi:predicted alpha/beta hydrolase